MHSAENSVSLCDDSDGDVVGEKSDDDVKLRTCPSSWFGCTRGAPTQPLSPLSSSIERVFFSDRHFHLSLFQSHLMPKTAFSSRLM